MNTYKQQAKRLRSRLESLNIEISHSHALEAVAAIHDCKNYNTLKAIGSRASDNIPNVSGGGDYALPESNEQASVGPSISSDCIGTTIEFSPMISDTTGSEEIDGIRSVTLTPSESDLLLAHIEEMGEAHLIEQRLQYTATIGGREILVADTHPSDLLNCTQKTQIRDFTMFNKTLKEWIDLGCNEVLFIFNK